MRRLVLLAFAVAVVLPFSARAQMKTDFSGTWTLDASKSDAPGGRGGRGPQGPVTIKQTATDIAIGSATYKLDGSESVNQMQGRGGMMEAKSKTHWDGAKLVIETTRDMGGNMVTSTETRSLSADGKEMTVETSFNGNTRKAVFTKGM
jgi:hypothetical protein